MSARYIQLSDEIIENITLGKLTVGQRMPSIRKMTRLHQVSVTTVLSCYHRLEESGWLSAKAQSGFFVSHPLNRQAVPEFDSFKVQVTKPRKSLEEEYIADNDRPFYTAQLAMNLIPVDVLIRAQHRAVQQAPEKIMQYPAIQGDEGLRAVLAQHFTQHYFPLSANKLSITNGCIDAVRIALEVTTNKGDVVAVTSPCFNGLLDLLRSMQRLVIEVPSSDAGIDLEQLAQCLSKKQVKACLFSASYANPQGLCLSNQQKQAIVNLAETYQVPIIEDDIYLELGYGKVAPLPIKHWDKNGWVLWCGSVSKTIGAGHRVGWCESGRFFEQYLSYLKGHFARVNSIAQLTVCEFISSGQYLKHLKKLKVTLATHAFEYHQLLRKCLGSNAKISAIEGGLVLWVQIAGLDSQTLVAKAKKQQIYLKAGREFTSRNSYTDCFRLNIGWSISEESANSSVNARQQLEALCVLIEETMQTDIE